MSDTKNPLPSQSGARPKRIVAIGASAGALPALGQFFRAASDASHGMAFIVVVHLSPDSESHLAELLSQETPLKVCVIEEGLLIEAGGVYVIPPKVLATIASNAFHLEPVMERPGIPMPIDRLFTSLAADQGDRAIGIVLTGANADGSAGLRAIKAEGGMVMAQSPETAEHSAMPKYAISTGLVDFVMPVAKMPAALVEYVDRSESVTLRDPEADNPVADLEPVLRALAAAGSDFRGYKRGTLERRIARRMSVNRLTSLEAYCDLLRNRDEEAEALSLDMMIGVTEFFRDPDAWRVLADRVLGPLLSEPDGEQPLRVWVPGCATGEEAYSMAMLLKEEIEKRQGSRKFMILASDVNRAALVRARAGIYAPGTALPLGQARLERFFQAHADGYQVRPCLRDTILFTPQNLIADPPFSRVDLISCRNLLIYLEPEAQQRVFELFHFSLNPLRYLFLGRSESTDPDSVQFNEVSKAWRIYQRTPAAVNVSGYRFAARPVRREEFPPSSRAGARSKGYAELVNATLLAEHHAASVLVNASHQVLYISGAADEYLAQSAGEPTGNLLDMAREGLRLKLRIALRRAVDSGSPDPVSEVVSNNDALPVKITVTRPFDTPNVNGALLVIFARLPVAERPALAVPSGVDSDLWHLESELRTTQAALGNTIEELEETNSELRVSNEEILSMNEELRSANEELETSKEELQAVNEQLNLVNLQLEQKVAQATALNDDITNLLASTEIATVLLDGQGVLKRFTPAAGKMFGLAPADIGQAFAELLGAPLGDALMLDVERVASGLTEHAEREIHTASGLYYVRRITPYAVVRGLSPVGAVITWTDITHIRQSDERARRLAAVVQNSNDAITVFGLKGRFLAWNRAATEIYGFSEDEALGMSVSDLLPAGARADHLDFIRHALDNEALHSYETQRIAKDGHVIDIWLTLSILQDESGNAIAVASTERDMSDRSASNAQLRERAEQLALADRRKNEFLAMLGHELRNPLAALWSAGNLLASDVADDSKKTWATGVIQRQGAAMMRLVNDMLDISRISSGGIELNRQTVALRSVMQSALEVCQPIIDERRHKLKVSLPGDDMYLYADPTRLSQVIENIVINAAKFTPPGGQIAIRVTSSAHRLSMSIKDNGRGIPSSMLGNLFDMFVQGVASDSQRDHGLGVGLSVVRRLVELHGGSVRALSDGRTGSEFIIDLPLGAPPGKQGTSDLTGPEDPPRPRRILIIDDNADAAEALRMLLEIDGHQLEVHADGSSGIVAADTFRPEIILLDIGLPDMDGYTVAKKLRELEGGHRLILVAVTGYGLPADRIRSAEAGFDYHLTKPLDMQDVARILRALA
ncbi:two-component system CheB/CheR fusion protein [Paraburkholderia sp. GAS199]|uniref:chemotaxis protein CheB n=1 Tax=Paraburkholderia sp. GAS199 TaxID=3035126 RepID=UPI003D24C50B